MTKIASTHDVDFVISTGDNFYGSGVSGTDDPHWQDAFEQIYNSPALQVPWYAVLGNHDHKGNVDAEMKYATVDPRWIMPAPYFSVTRGVGKAKADFFYLDTEVLQATDLITEWLNSAKSDQLVWLEDQLSKSTAQWKIVVGHHPLYSGGAHGDIAELLRILKPLFEKYGVNAYLAGHDHDLEALQDGDIAYFVSGGGSKDRPMEPNARSRFAVSEPGFLLIELSEGEGEATFYDETAKALFSEKLSR